MTVPNLRPGQKSETTFGPWKDGIDEKTEPGRLSNSFLKAASNVLLDEVPGVITKRNGSIVIANLPSGNPPKFGYSFKKSDGSEYFLLSDGEIMYSTQDLVTLSEIKTGLDSAGYLQFITAEDKCWILNGIDDVMWYDGTNFVVMDREATDGTTESGTNQNQIVDVTKRSGDIDDYWNNRKVVITSGTYAGMEGTVTDFDQASSTLTISGFTIAPGVGVTYSVGVIIPKGRIIRYDGNNMFIGATTENRSEIRFSRLADIDDGNPISLDNPRAWPPQYQLAITQDDGDQVWTFSPVYRNRFLVSKGTAIYRIEPDATFIFVPVLVSNEIGCRNPDSWVVKNELLYFLGNERSGILDLYKTDMVSVKPVHKDGRMLPTFDEMYRAEPVYKYISRASAQHFITGDISTTCKVGLGRLESKEFDTDSDWENIKDVFTNINQGESRLAMVGIPDWVVNYDPGVSTGGAGDPNDLPNAADPEWTIRREVFDASSETVSGGNLVLSISSGTTSYYKTVENSTKNTYMSGSIKFPAFRTIGGFMIRTDNKELFFHYRYHDDYGIGLYIGSTFISSFDPSVEHYFNILLDSDNNGKLWIDGVKVWEGVGYNITTAPIDDWFLIGSISNIVLFGFRALTLGTRVCYFDKVKYDDDFNFKVSDMPDTLPETATAVIKFDYTRTPDAFGPLFGTFELNGGTVTIKTASSADDSSYESYLSLTNGQEPGVDNVTTVQRYLKVEFTLTRADVANGPVLEKLMCGFLWRMTGQLVGSNIVQWRKWADEDTTPAGTSIVKKIRLAKTVAAPSEGDYGAWVTIVDGDNIGTILGESDPVVVDPGESRWIDAKIEGYPSAAGITPDLENFLINWVEGSDAKLALTSIIYKKRLYLTSISATAEANDLLLVLDSNDSWTKFNGLNLFRQVLFRGLIYGLSSVDDKIFQMDAQGVYDDNGVAIDAYIETGALDFGHGRYEIENVKIGNNVVISSVKVLLSTDGETWTLKGTIDFLGEGTYNLRIHRGWIGKRHFTKLQSSEAQAMGIRMLKQVGKMHSEE